MIITLPITVLGLFLQAQRKAHQTPEADRLLASGAATG